MNNCLQRQIPPKADLNTKLCVLQLTSYLASQRKKSRRETGKEVSGSMFAILTVLRVSTYHLVAWGAPEVMENGRGRLQSISKPLVGTWNLRCTVPP